MADLHHPTCFFVSWEPTVTLLPLTVSAVSAANTLIILSKEGQTVVNKIILVSRCSTEVVAAPIVDAEPFIICCSRSDTLQC